MDATNLEAELTEAQSAVTRQADGVRSLKAALKDGQADKAEVDAAIAELKRLKAVQDEKQKVQAANGRVPSDKISPHQAYDDTAGRTIGSNKEAFRAALNTTLTSKLFYIPSFQIYGSVAGFYDFGPPGCAVKQNITQFWRNHFVLEENMLEVECPAVTPEAVLRASGHVERFSDFMVRDVKTGDCHRADHLLEVKLEALLEDTKKPLPPDERRQVADLLARVGELDAPALGNALRQHGVTAPDTGNPVSEPFPFNLMFRTSIGPAGNQVGYLRPETAQGIFVNFSFLLYYNGGKLPFAAAQVGQSYRNEIAPRAGLLRVREFTQAEIEHFCDPDDKSHPKFKSVAGLEPLLFSRELQMGEEKKALPLALGEAVQRGIIANQTLAYFIGRTYLFMIRIGIDPQKLRFRQHLQHEMAHYAEDCWDAEVSCSYGWVECAGLADRSAFDLKAHAAATQKDLTAFQKYDSPVEVERLVVTPNKQAIGAVFKREAKAVADHLAGLPEDAAEDLQRRLQSGVAAVTIGGKEVEIAPAQVKIERQKKKVSGRNFTPSVIEPSLGIGRIIYCMFEHCYDTREGDEKRVFFRFTPVVAPVKATVFPLLQRSELNRPAERISAHLRAAGLSNIIDVTGTQIGKRYARTDEIGVPFAVTVDYQTLEDDTVTLRERDSMAQVRVPSSDVPSVIRQLVGDHLKWQDVAAKYPAQAAPAEK